MSAHVLGLDLSLTCTGVVEVHDGRITASRIKSAGHAGDSLSQRTERLHAILWTIVGTTEQVDLVVIEQPAYNAMGGHHHDRSGLWWLVMARYIAVDIPVAEVPPSTLKKYATGKGNAGKDQMLAAAIRRYPDAGIEDNNVADAAHLASMGCRFLGAPLEASETVGMTQAMHAVRWPEIVA